MLVILSASDRREANLECFLSEVPVFGRFTLNVISKSLQWHAEFATAVFLFSFLMTNVYEQQFYHMYLEGKFPVKENSSKSILLFVV